MLRTFTICSASSTRLLVSRIVDRDKAIPGNFFAGSQKEFDLCVVCRPYREGSLEMIPNETERTQQRRTRNQRESVIRASYAATTTSAAYQKNRELRPLCLRVCLEFDIDQKRAVAGSRKRWRRRGTLTVFVSFASNREAFLTDDHIHRE